MLTGTCSPVSVYYGLHILVVYSGSISIGLHIHVVSVYYSVYSGIIYIVKTGRRKCALSVGSRESIIVGTRACSPGKNSVIWCILKRLHFNKVRPLNMRINRRKS